MKKQNTEIKTENQEKITEVVFIIDRSGSMSGFESDTVGGFNSTIEKQKENEGKVLVSTVFFDNDSEVIHDRVNIEDIKPLTRKDYYVRGCTALYDAIGNAVKHIGNIHKYARKEDVPESTIFVIITDGMENASHKYSQRQIKAKIEEQKEKYGWEFIFLGANIDSKEAAGSIGINDAVDYCQDKEGFEATYMSVNCAITGVRKNRALSQDWCGAVNKDNQRRKK